MDTNRHDRDMETDTDSDTDRDTNTDTVTKVLGFKQKNPPTTV